MMFKATRTGLQWVALSMCTTLGIQGTAKAQNAGLAPQSKLGPVAEVESRPLDATPPTASVIDPGIIPSRQALTPAGLQSVFRSMVYGVAFGDQGNSIYAATVSQKGAFVYQINLNSNHMMAVLSSAANPGLQALAYDPITHTPLMSGLARHGKAEGSGGQLVALGQSSSVVAGNLGTNQMGSLALGLTKNAAGHRLAVVALTFNDEAAVIDLDTKEVVSKIKTGVAPFGVAVSSDSSVAYVSNFGGRFTNPGERTAATGPQPHADQVLVDERGVASSGTLSRIDLVTGKVTASVNVGLHPTGLAWDEQHHRLYVSNSNSDTISVVDTETNRVIDTIVLRPFLKKVAGISPESVALSPDHSTLYAACAGINAVAVFQLTGAHPEMTGMIPTGWYPTDVVVSPNEKYIAVSTLLGVGSGWNSPGVMHSQNFVAGVYDGRIRPEMSIYSRYVHANRGSVHIIPVPDQDELDRYSIAVAENNHMNLPGAAENAALSKPRPGIEPQPVPTRMGEPSLFDHVVFIIKENRSYDQYFGDLSKGNGDPTLHVYGDDVIPNQRKLAQEFVLLDNFYANGGNSADGHQWVTQGTETDYTHWAADGGRSYPKNGDDPLAFASSGFLWDHLAQHHKTFVDFGEYEGELQSQFKWSDADDNRLRAKLLTEYTQGQRDFSGMFHTVAPIARLNQYVVKDYPAYGLQIPDVVRSSIFLQHLHKWQNGEGDMPNLVMIQLPGDVTLATSPGFSDPEACMADNDLALGNIVDGITHSKFWKSTLILVVEDDAQNGLDHVDGHRTVALAISPYTKRGSVDSTFYSQVSMVKTIELIMGEPPMSLFDLIANDMRSSFQSTPNLTPFDVVAPTHSLFTVNPGLAALTGQARTDALASSKMNWSDPDDNPAEPFNQILWRSAMGTQPYPAWKRGSAFFHAAPGE